MKNPDKWIRKFFSERLSNMVVNGFTVKLYDTTTPNNDSFLIVLSTQSGRDNWQTKCSVDKLRDINIDIITRFKGNVGSRALLDDIVEEVLQRTEEIKIENFVLQYFNISFPLDINQSTATETIYRKIIKYSLKLKEDGR
ncbi:hypothetical protein SAMN05421866_3486 [Chryseobacterium oranimense]|uniref:Uncharacterized protein n=1 Tax=Chryseobacterium oranimense TaxID=421058 RepID=A0A1M5V0R5_9FLAO|nr:hypothetical protein [Chryseobacterium oranimense]SHH68819.1 hypothetical protein SAMN05421866_3486 [Chryseobacterium oranimense]